MIHWSWRRPRTEEGSASAFKALMLSAQADIEAGAMKPARVIYETPDRRKVQIPRVWRLQRRA